MVSTTYSPACSPTGLRVAGGLFGQRGKFSRGNAALELFLSSAAAGNLRKLFVENSLWLFFSSPCASFKIPAISRIAWALSSHETDRGFFVVLPQENYWATTFRVSRNIRTKVAVAPSFLRPPDIQINNDAADQPDGTFDFNTHTKETKRRPAASSSPPLP